MKIIEREKTVKEIVGYEANDGTNFKTEEECKKYEETLECIVKSRVLSRKLLETTEYELTDFGSDDYMYYVINTLENADQVYDLEMYNKLYRCGHKEPFEIGKKYVLNGFSFDEIDNIVELEKLFNYITTGFRVLARHNCKTEVVNYLTKLLNEIQNEETEK